MRQIFYIHIFLEEDDLLLFYISHIVHVLGSDSLEYLLTMLLVICIVHI